VSAWSQATSNIKVIFMNPLTSNYIGHDPVYQRLKAEGAFGWSSEEDHLQVVRPRIRQVIDRCAVPPGSRILDLGCGTGDLAIWLTQQGYEAYGIDIAPTAIAWAQEKADTQQTRVQFTQGNVVDLQPYDDDVFRLVVDGRCLHCIIGPDRATMLASIYRVLQPGGCFFVQTMCGEVMDGSSIEPTFDPISRHQISKQGFATRYIGKAEDILNELRTTGFEIAHQEIVPRVSHDDQDDLLTTAVKPAR
jgi:ubiquinone/menaquinone biosynthesis C-methylase UbiE